MTTEAMTEAQSDHVRIYVAHSNCIRVLRGKNSLNARKTWTELGEMPYHVPHEFSSKSLVKLLGKTPMRGSCKKCSLLARLRAHDALASHALKLQHFGKRSRAAKNICRLGKYDRRTN